ncbi:hypothetical protein CcaverHIS002_0107230 [Cutaneotrichosporon cavernicola]|uniref:S-adenosyl-L-methionine-dependent methyltransferase n=1 Tax=Cutaneotrichosporon cavernicola TaxID=279322 RepID=A0AA48HYU6_9TREE|nr:uncharacterized protein CcaverHIS019_0107190 [Cutaneotrichosporon cavernicola]BEI80194.1 hypothetical protein CcaverHIS002_0107230 [Cutaneotrichosporon cavernicola]BEI88001.1 hypothetical protein CcaverHIS019_0107190 [Cutaneotrichosporon cavernicola]BEJ03549.1 hypothetical protein CcaverHIS641_0107240 [Cutaneotrichosporon cavernicola]
MNLLVVLALVPLIWRLAVQFLPAQWTEPYAYWDPDALNDGLARWSNMGYWDDASSFSEAGEALARRLLAFADASNERVLDIAHGPGDSLLLHLESNPKHLTAIASLPSDTETAQQRVNQWFLEHAGKTDLTWYTGSATFRPAKDFDHPLYPMRGFLGDSNVVVEEEEEEREQVVFDDEADVVDVEEVVLDKAKSQTGIDLYDLVYVLDALYHFPPSRSAFIASVLPNLRPGGVLAYTDILAPPSLSRLPGRLLANLLSTLLRVPQSNLASGITLNQYKSSLEDMGYKVQLQDWTTHVFPGFAANLKARGAGWWVVGWLAEKAEASGWKYVAVRAERSST